MDAQTRKPWPTEKQRAADPDWTARHPRPTDGDFHPSLLPGLQAEWDRGEARRKKVAERAAAILAEREAAAHERREAAQQREDERRQRKLAAREEELRRSHLAAGGTETTWEAGKTAIVAADLQAKTLAGEDAARETSRRTMYRTF